MLRGGTASAVLEMFALPGGRPGEVVSESGRTGRELGPAAGAAGRIKQEHGGRAGQRADEHATEQQPTACLVGALLVGDVVAVRDGVGQTALEQRQKVHS